MQANEATQSSCVPPRSRDLNVHHVRVCSPLLRDPFPLKPPDIYIGVGTLSHEFDKAQKMMALKNVLHFILLFSKQHGTSFWQYGL